MKNINRMTKSQLITELAAVQKKLAKQEALVKKHKKIEEQQAQLIGELDAFAHTVAHDLQVPLSLIVGNAGILEEDYAGMPPEQVQKLLRIISKTGLRMSKIIEELLLLADIRDREVVREPLDMAAIVEAARERLVNMIEEREAEIIVPDEWPVASGYTPWIEEVWANYLSNGLKYGGQPPLLELGATRQPHGMVRFWIRDNGPGLTLEQQSRMFTPFVQLSQVRGKGHGLGLSIVYRIINKKLGGYVGVESTGIGGQGSTFYFTLPAVDDSENAPIDSGIIKRYDGYYVT